MPESRFCSCHDDATLSSTLERHDDAFVCANRVAQTQGGFVRGICGTFLPAAAPCCTRTGYVTGMPNGHQTMYLQRVGCLSGFPACRHVATQIHIAYHSSSPARLCAQERFLLSKVLTPAVSQGVSLALMGKNCCWGGKRESSAKIHFYPKSGSKIPICPPFLGLNQHDYIFAHLARIISQTRECRSYCDCPLQQTVGKGFILSKLGGFFWDVPPYHHVIKKP